MSMEAHTGESRTDDGVTARYRCNVSVYTTHEQSEQPAIVHNVTALTVVGGLLTIECDVAENGYTFSAFHRFERGEWVHFSATYFGGSGTHEETTR